MSGSAELIRAIGESLYGWEWKTELADELRLNRRTMQRWVNGQNEPQPGVWDDLDRLLAERVAEMEALRKLLAQREEVAP